MSRSLPFRQIHLDFHTSPAINDVGSAFDPGEFARAMVKSHVNSVNLFAKCHHGHLYYDTNRPERHPGLSRNLPLLEQQIEALRRHGIKTPIYISVQCDEYAVNTHPEWAALQPDGRPAGAGPLQPGWTILDMSSDYQEYLAEQTAEILEHFRPVDGIWFDMCWSQTSSSESAIRGMLKESMNPENAEDRDKYANLVSQRYMRRFHQMAQTASPGALVYFNGRKLPRLRGEIDYFEQVEIEALPTGGWSYQYFPTNVRYVRNLGKPSVGMTARFHKSWADFGGLKPEAALIYETSQMVAHGAACCIGDQLHPRGTLDAAAYELIGRIYKRIEEREPWLAGAVPVTQIGVITPQKDARREFGTAIDGAVRMLSQLKHQFDILDQESDWKGYELLVLPDRVQVDAAFAERLTAYVAGGGKVLASGHSGLSEDGSEVIWKPLGVTAHGPSPFSATYIRFGDSVAPGAPQTDHVVYDRGIRVKAADAQAMAHVVEPYFERTYLHFCSHNQTPSDRLTDYAAAALTGHVSYVSYPIFSAFSTHGNAPYRTLVKALLDRLIEPIVRCDAPTGAEVTLTRQGSRTIVHILYFSAERRAPGLDLIEDIVPLHNVPVTVRTERCPGAVTVVPEQRSIPFHWDNGHITFTIPVVPGHAMLAIE